MVARDSGCAGLRRGGGERRSRRRRRRRRSRRKRQPRRRMVSRKSKGTMNIRTAMVHSSGCRCDLYDVDRCMLMEKPNG